MFKDIIWSFPSSAIDLWLHTVTSTVLFTKLTPVVDQQNYSIGQEICPPYPDPFYDAVWPCLWSPDGWAGGTLAGLTPGKLVSTNSSDALQSITISNSSDLAVLVVPSLPQLLSFRMETFGARASCQSVTPLCGITPINATANTVSCEGFPPSFVAYDWTSSGQPKDVGLGDSKLYIQTSNCDGCSHTLADSDAFEVEGVDTLEPSMTPINSYSTWMQFVWVNEADAVLDSTQASDALLTPNEGITATMLTNCSLSFYNVTLDYYNGSYAVHTEILSNTGLSDGLAGPTRLGHFSERLITDIEGRVFSDNDSASVMALLSQDFARLALGSAAIITNVTVPTVSTQNQIIQLILGRYPVWPVIIFLALLYAYSALALTILLVTTILARDTMIETPSIGRDDDEINHVSALELTQLRLTSPLPLVATLFSRSLPQAQRSTLSMRTDALDAFGEGPNDERLIIGFEGPIKAIETPWRQFGLWKRRVTSLP